MSFFVTAEGNPIDVAKPNPEHITPYTLAWSQAQISRFGGHALRPYSVAEHTLLALDIARNELGMREPLALLAVLMHDAHEALCGADLPTPHKRTIAGWKAHEHRWAEIVRARFGLVGTFFAFDQSIRATDLIALATERRDLMHPADQSRWPILDGVVPTTRINLASRERRDATWEHWRDRWLDAYHELQAAIAKSQGRIYGQEAAQ